MGKLQWTSGIIDDVNEVPTTEPETQKDVSVMESGESRPGHAPNHPELNKPEENPAAPVEEPEEDVLHLGPSPIEPHFHDSMKDVIDSEGDRESRMQKLYSDEIGAHAFQSALKLHVGTHCSKFSSPGTGTATVTLAGRYTRRSPTALLQVERLSGVNSWETFQEIYLAMDNQTSLQSDLNGVDTYRWVLKLLSGGGGIFHFELDTPAYLSTSRPDMGCEQ